MGGTGKSWTIPKPAQNGPATSGFASARCGSREHDAFAERFWCMEPRWCDRPFPGWLADPDCVWFRRTDRAIECVDLHGDFGLLGLECASGELATVEPLDASHHCFAKRSQSVALSFLPVHPSLRRDLRRMVLPFRSAMRRVRGRNGCGAWRDDDFR